MFLKLRAVILILLVANMTNGFCQVPTKSIVQKIDKKIAVQIDAPTKNKVFTKDKHEMYEYYADIYNVRNDVVIPIDIYIWQKDDGTENYLKTASTDSVFSTSIAYMNQMFTENVEPVFQPIPGTIDYPSTKIRFRLENIYYEQNTRCWESGSSVSYREGIFLNRIADSLHPLSNSNFKIHITGAQSKHSGFATFPQKYKTHQHFIVTFNKSRETKREGDNALWSAWPLATHFAHEMAHNLDLYHTYDGGHCNEENPDYLDDVFGTSVYGNKMCPQQGGWDCDYINPENSCTNNIMGGSKDGRYFSPKQILRMHRALALYSIGNYAVAYDFNKSKTIDIANEETWDFNAKWFNTIRIKRGAILRIKGHIEFVPEARIVVEPGAELIIDNGVLTNEKYFKTTWGGVEIGHKKRKKNRFLGTVSLINNGKIENTNPPFQD